MDDYSFGWTSAAGIIADFCAIGGEITKRVFPPLNTTDYSSYVRQLPQPGQVDGYFWVVGGTGTGPALKAFEQAYGPIKPTQHSGNLFLWFLTGQGRRRTTADRRVRRRLRHGTGPEDEGCDRRTGPSSTSGTRGTPADDGFFYNYYQGTRALDHRPERVRRSSRGEAAERPSEDHLGSVRALRPAGTSSSTRTGRRSRISGRCRSSRAPDGGPAVTLTGYVPNVEPVVRRPLQEDEPAARPHAACVREEDAAVAGQDPRGEGRRRHEHGHQVRQ